MAEFPKRESVPDTQRIDSNTLHTILVLTAGGDEALLTRAQARLLFSLHRRPIPMSAMLSCDLFDDRKTTIGPVDENGLRALAWLFCRQLIRRGLLYRESQAAGRSRMVLRSPDPQQPAVHPASAQRGLRWQLRHGSLLADGDGHDPDALPIPVGVCPQCRRLLLPGRNCPQHPLIRPEAGASLRIGKPVQRLVWLSWKLSRPVTVLLVEPSLLNGRLGLFLAFLSQRPHAPSFQEIIVWPRQPFRKFRPAAGDQPATTAQALTMLWSGWRDLSSPPSGRLRFIERLERGWPRLLQAARTRPPHTGRGRESGSAAMHIDRWLLHSFNLTVAAFLLDEDRRRSAQALEKLAGFIRHQLISGFLDWRRNDWDAGARQVLDTVMSALVGLTAPYGLDFSIEGGLAPSGPVSPLLYRNDWIYPREYKTVESALQLRRAIAALQGELHRAELPTSGQIRLCAPRARTVPRDLNALLQRMLPKTGIEFASETELRTLPGLRAQAGSWRIVLTLENDELRRRLLEFYRQRLLHDQQSYEAYRVLYTAHRHDPDASQTHLKAMRGRLMSLKKRQMISLTRAHELQ